MSDLNFLIFFIERIKLRFYIEKKVFIHINPKKIVQCFEIQKLDKNLGLLQLSVNHWSFIVSCFNQAGTLEGNSLQSLCLYKILLKIRNKTS